MPQSIETYYVTRGSDIAWEETESGVVLVNFQTGDFFSFRKPHSMVWKFCDGKHSIAEIARLIGPDCGLEEEAAFHEVFSALERFSQWGVIDFWPRAAPEALLLEGG